MTKSVLVGCVFPLPGVITLDASPVDVFAAPAGGAVPSLIRRSSRYRTVAAIATLLALGTAATAAEIEVKMLNKGAEGMMVFEPSFLKIAAIGTHDELMKTSEAYSRIFRE